MFDLYHLQSVLQLTEIIESSVLGAINMQLADIFGPHKSIFMKTTVKDVLFDGIKFCDNPGVIGNLICEIVRNKNLQSIHPGPNGSMKFAFFYHVNIYVFYYMHYLVNKQSNFHNDIISIHNTEFY